MKIVEVPTKKETDIDNTVRQILGDVNITGLSIAGRKRMKFSSTKPKNYSDAVNHRGQIQALEEANYVRERKKTIQQLKMDLVILDEFLENPEQVLDDKDGHSTSKKRSLIQHQASCKRGEILTQF